MTLNTLGKTTEEVEDIIGSLVVGSGDVNVTYDDTNDQLSIDVSTLTNEEVQDTVASLVTSDSNLSWSYDDTNDTLTVSLSDSISVNTLEAGTIVDGAGVTHTDELADKSDVGGVGFPYDINDVQDVPDSRSVVVEGPVNVIDGTLDDRNARVKIE
jgi:hypothetical protein